MVEFHPDDRIGLALLIHDTELRLRIINLLKVQPERDASPALRPWPEIHKLSRSGNIKTLIHAPGQHHRLRTAHALYGFFPRL
jgi:hypothetical protein